MPFWSQPQFPETSELSITSVVFEITNTSKLSIISENSESGCKELKMTKLQKVGGYPRHHGSGGGMLWVGLLPHSPTIFFPKNKIYV